MLKNEKNALIKLININFKFKKWLFKCAWKAWKIIKKILVKEEINNKKIYKIIQKY